jgi:hypothetical protein
MRLDSIALAAAALALSAPALHVDVDGDGFADTVAVSHGRLDVVTRTGLVSARVPPGARVDGALRVRALRGALLLVRIGSRQLVSDAVYRVTTTGVYRVHLRGGTTADTLVRAAGTGSFTDFDCGAAPLTVEQIAGRPDGARWDETVLTYALRVRGLVLQSVRRVSISGPAAGKRRCALVGR